jgi:molybdopterin converting factor small subunit
MVVVTFKMSELGTVEVNLNGKMKLSEVLDEIYHSYDEKMGDIIAVRSNKVMRLDEIVNDDDEIVIFPALSGG